jgi:hypothetical protein
MMKLDFCIATFMVHETTPCMAFAMVPQLSLTNVFRGNFEPSKIEKGMCSLQNWSWGG